MPSIFTQTYGYSLLTFGFFTAVALVAGIYMFREEAKTTGCDLQRIDSLCFWMLIAAILGARLFYFVINPDALAAGWLELFRIWNGGVSLAGGAAVAATVGLGYAKSAKMPMLRTLDAFAPAVAIGQFFAWLGCFFSGLCRQISGNSVWNAHTAPVDPAAYAEVHLHPAALFIAAGHFVIFGLLLLVKQHRRFDGQTFWLYVLLLAALGLAVGITSKFRAAAPVIGLPPSLLINAALAVTSAAALLILRRRGKKQKPISAARRDGDNE